MDVKPELVTVQEDNHRYKKRKSFRNKEVIVKAVLIVAVIFGFILAAMIYAS